MGHITATVQAAVKKEDIRGTHPRAHRTGHHNNASSSCCFFSLLRKYLRPVRAWCWELASVECHFLAAILVRCLSRCLPLRSQVLLYWSWAPTLTEGSMMTVTLLRAANLPTDSVIWEDTELPCWSAGTLLTKPFMCSHPGQATPFSRYLVDCRTRELRVIIMNFGVPKLFLNKGSAKLVLTTQGEPGHGGQSGHFAPRVIQHMANNSFHVLKM